MTGFRMKGSLKRTTMLARQGIVFGGSWDGWRYTFDHFSVGKGGRLNVHLVVNEAGWPFPKNVALRPADFRRLVPVAGERAPRLDTRQLIDEARGGLAGAVSTGSSPS